MRITKTEFTTKFSEATGFTKKNSALAVQKFLDLVKEELVKGNEVKFVGFGKFSVVDRAARKGRNPQNGNEITIPSHKAISFHAGNDLKGSLK